MQANTILEAIMSAPPDLPALSAPGMPPLSYGQLHDLTTDVAASLHAAGIAPGDRIAIVLAPGPELAAAFLTIASAASTAPLNPAYSIGEFETYLADIKPRAIVLHEKDVSPARDAAATLGVPVIELRTSGTVPAGTFELITALAPTTKDKAPAPHSKPVSADAEALVLHTSGTTSRPKLVPLTQRNLLTSAHNVAHTLGLEATDRALNVMPLFHIHGLVGSVLSSIVSHAHVVCAPGFNALKIFRWLDEARPTWLTAVPTMHQAILARAKHNADVVERVRGTLRLVRSSSAPLPPTIADELEHVFGAPVVQAYGMTEAAHQIASQRPTDASPPQTVGSAAGPDVAVKTADGAIQTLNANGEILISGPNVFGGYADNPEANRDAFFDGWFRTGDFGVLDELGELTITGRLKEFINRGGEKIAPREIDEALVAHPDVNEAVAFAVPHPTLGEDVVAAVTLHNAAAIDEAGLRSFLDGKLAAFKIPRRIFVRDDIPKGATGKLQRIGLAAKLGLVP